MQNNRQGENCDNGKDTEGGVILKLKALGLLLENLINKPWYPGHPGGTTLKVRDSHLCFQPVLYEHERKNSEGWRHVQEVKNKKA